MRFLLVSILFFNSIFCFGQSLKGGVALRVITPDPLLPISGGVAIPKKSTEKKGDLYARAMVLQYEDIKVALVSVDNLGWPAVLGDKTRARIKTIFPENILIGATHTHSAPDAYAFPDEFGKNHAEMKYLNWCASQIAEAIKEAEKNLEDIDIKIAHESIASGIAYNYYAPELYDTRCGVFQIFSKKTGKALSTLVNYAVHPEVIGSHSGILSPDLCGPLYDLIELNGGGMAMFFNGALGGMVTADNRRQNGEENTWEECIRIGNLLGSGALRIVKEKSFETNVALKIESHTIEFPVDSPMMKFILDRSPMGYKVSASTQISTVQNLLRIGSASFLTIPGEALPNIGFYLKRQLNTQYPFLLGLTNDAFGYILTKEDYSSFKRYEYVSRTSLGESTGEILVESSLELMKK